MSPTDSTKEIPMANGLEVVQHPPNVPPHSLGHNQYPLHQHTVTAYAVGPEKGAVAGSREKTICGLRKVTFWLSLAIASLTIIVVAVAVGLGAGLGLRKDGSSSSSPAAAGISSAAASPTLSTVSHSTATSTTSSAKSTSTSFSGANSISCPDDNDVVKAMDGGSGIQYLIQCGADFLGGKKELASMKMPSFADCLYLCDSMNRFQDRDDIGATFYNQVVHGQAKGTCWCLGNATETYDVEGLGIAIPQ